MSRKKSSRLINILVGTTVLGAVAISSIDFNHESKSKEPQIQASIQPREIRKTEGDYENIIGYSSAIVSLLLTGYLIRTKKDKKYQQQ